MVPSPLNGAGPHFDADCVEAGDEDVLWELDCASRFVASSAQNSSARAETGRRPDIATSWKYGLRFENYTPRTPLMVSG